MKLMILNLRICLRLAVELAEAEETMDVLGCPVGSLGPIGVEECRSYC